MWPDLIRAGHTEEARKVQLDEIVPSADRLERLTNQLVNIAEADMVAAIETTEGAYSTSRLIVVSFAVGSILLALGLGYIISWSLVEPVKKIETRLRQIAAGEFAQQVAVANRDELGELAGNVNQTSEQVGAAVSGDRGAQPRVERGARAADGNQRDPARHRSFPDGHSAGAETPSAESAAKLCDAYDGVILLEGRRIPRSHEAHSRIYSDRLRVQMADRTRLGFRGVPLWTRSRFMWMISANAGDDFPAGQGDGDTRSAIGRRLPLPLLREDEAIGVLVIRRLENAAVQPKADRPAHDLRRPGGDRHREWAVQEVQARTTELARPVGELEALGEVSKAVNSTLDLDTVLKTIVAKAVQLSGTDAGTIYVFSSTTQQFRLRATYGMSEELIAAMSNQAIGLNDMGIGDTAERCTPVQVPDLAAGTPSHVQKIVLDAGYRSILVIPLLRPKRSSARWSSGAASQVNSTSRSYTCWRHSRHNRCSQSRTPSCSARSRKRAVSWRQPAATNPSSSRI